MSCKHPLSFPTAFDSYSVGEKLGEGGSGRVFKAQDSSGNVVAIKVLNPRELGSDKLRRFKNETHFCLRRPHKNILRVLDYGVVSVGDKQCPFYVMPFYGGTLRTLMDMQLEPLRLMVYFSQILDGVEAAHLLRVWHRDLKPENILFDQESDSLVIADFGIARFVKEYLYTIVETKPTNRLANFQYAAPEQKKRGAIVDHRADIYALGLILNEMFTGEVIQGTSFKTISSIEQDWAYLDEAVERMIRFSPDDRFQSIDLIKQNLIACHNEFISRQKLSLLETKVIPRVETDDPLIRNPVHVTEIDYEAGHLVFTLSGEISHEWQEVFHKLPVSSRYGQHGPKSAKFQNGLAWLPIRSTLEAQIIVDTFKEYLKATNKEYARRVEIKLRQKEEAERAELKKKLEEAKRKQQILSSINP
jgi:serine/threonine protein kinase